ncbi:hypothetical protein NP493_115g09011 [Ridgeia piscesae]|uniref:Uncharacterized protein n=1 Tax=Ridgeia piscesae TaxID=27915 RepID=A0AAD9P6M4_RIDPI|nr:hypothetical protein NP493_115g09011 [Ridgeia piscesae]
MSQRLSQTTLLDEVSRWDRQTCQQRLDDILPQLIVSFNKFNSVFWSHQNFALCLFVHPFHVRIIFILDVLQVLFQAVLPAVSTDRLEECILSKVSGKVTEQFENILGRLLDATSMQLESVLADLQESGTIYKELLGSVSQQLSALFRKAHSLQMEFISLIDKVIISSSQTDLQDMCAVIHGICDLSDIATRLDVKGEHFRWLCRYKEQLCDWLDIGRMLRSLCRDMCASYCYTTSMTSHCPQGTEDQEEEKLFRKNVKILGFQMKVLVTLVKEFKDYLGSCVPQLCYTFSRIPPCLLAAPLRRDHIEDIERHVSVGVQPLMSYLIPNRHFMRCLTATERDSELHLPQLLALISVAGMVGKYPDDVRSLWIEPKKTSSEDTPELPLMTAIFSTLTQCMFFSSLGLIKETCLLENLFSQRLHSALLASDIWCFLARTGTAEQCHLQCVFLAKLHITVSPSPSSQCCHLAALVRRIVKLLTPEHQDEFISLFTVSPKTLSLWSVVSVSDLDVSLRHQVTGDIVTVCTQVIHVWCHMSTRTVDDAIMLENAVSCLTNLFQSDSVADYTDTKQRKNIVETSHDAWQTLSMTFVVRSPVLQNVVSSLFSLAAYILSDLDNKHVLQLVKNASACLCHGVRDHVKLAILCFLEHLGAKTLPPTFEFAEVTRHESVVPECLHGNEHVQKLVVHYLNQIPAKRFKADSIAETEERDVKYRTILSQLQVTMDKLSESASDLPPLPQWVREELEDIHAQMTTLMRK